MKGENRIFLKGKLGSDARVNTVNGNNVANFSVATEYEFKKRDGSWDKETTWLNVNAWQNNGMPDFGLLLKGTPVFVIGRIRNRKYTDKNGVEQTITEVAAESIDILANTDKTATAQPSNQPKGGYKPADEDEF